LFTKKIKKEEIIRMKFVIEGIESPSGKEKRIVVEAQTEDKAAAIASQQNIYTLKVSKLPPIPWGSVPNANASIRTFADSSPQ